MEGGLTWRSAVCGGHEMRRGRHYATFTLRSGQGCIAMLGVVGPGFDPTSTSFDSAVVAAESPQGWVLYTSNCCLYQSDRASELEWEGPSLPANGGLKVGDVVVRPPRCAAPCRVLRGCGRCVQAMVLDLMKVSMLFGPRQRLSREFKNQ